MNTAVAVNPQVARRLERGNAKALDEYLYRLACEQTRRDEQGRLMLPKDDDPEDEEILPPKYRHK